MDPYIGAITLFAFGQYVPKGWAFCDGQVLAISSNHALFSLIGVQFGGDGITTFALPDLKGRTPVHRVSNNIEIGTKGGAEFVTLNTAQMPVHTHSLAVATTTATTAVPTGNSLAQADFPIYAADGNTLVSLNSSSLSVSGGNQGHENRQPSLVLSFCIALTGAYPARS